MYKRSSLSWSKHKDFILLDLFALFLAMFFAVWIYQGAPNLFRSELYLNVTILLLALDALLLVMFNPFHNVMRRGYAIELGQTLKQTVALYAALTVILFAVKITGNFSRVTVSLSAVLYLFLSYFFRLAWKRVVRRSLPKQQKRKMVLVSHEADVQSVLSRSQGLDEASFAGLVLTDRDAEGETVCGLPVVANIDNAADYICREWVDEVFFYPSTMAELEIEENTDPDVESLINSPLEDLTDAKKKTSAAADIPQNYKRGAETLVRGTSFSSAQRQEAENGPEGVLPATGRHLQTPAPENPTAALLAQCRLMALPIHIRVPLGGLGEKSIVEKVNGFNVITYASNYASPLQLFIKRLMDILGGILGSLIALIIMLMVGPIIKSKSPGPIIYKQERIGQNGKRFKLYKIRSMYMDADERKKEFLAQNRVSDGMMFKLDFDPRIIGNEVLPDGTKKTGIGEFIRKYSLDEFPQFWNVLKGDMSIVGTRPPTVDEWEKYKYHHRARLAFRPGVTGMWQVSGRSNITDFEEVVRLDTEYIEHWSIGLDCRIILKTVKDMFSGKGAM